MAALVRADGNALHVFLQRGCDHFIYRTVVTQMDHFGTHALQDAAHDIDGCVVPVKQTGRGDKAHFVGRLVGSQCQVFSGQLSHGVWAV